MALRALESAVMGRESIDGVILRYGFFYGPGRRTHRVATSPVGADPGALVVSLAESDPFGVTFVDDADTRIQARQGASDSGLG